MTKMRTGRDGFLDIFDSLSAIYRKIIPCYEILIIKKYQIDKRQEVISNIHNIFQLFGNDTIDLF